MKKFLVIVAALAAATLTSTPAQALTPDLKLFTSNVGSGAECSADCLTTVFSQIDNWHPAVVALIEVCQSDVDQFSQRYPDWSVFYHPMWGSLDGCGGGTKGEMVASPTPFERTQMVDIPGDTELKDYASPCGDIGTVWVCAVHLSNVFNSDEANQTKSSQVQALVAATSGWSKAVLTGDFNVKPANTTVLSSLTDANYTETDRADDQFTQGPNEVRVSKYDYVWYHKGNAGNVTGVNGVVITQPVSNHDLLRGAIDW